MCYMYRMFMEFGEESPEYQEAMEKRDEALWKRYENAQQGLASRGTVEYTIMTSLCYHQFQNC